MAGLHPKLEVLSLVFPQLATAGRPLTSSLALSVVKDLCRYTSVDGKISFDRWFVVAKDQLKWNEYCVQLFWDMLTLSASPSPSVSLEHLVIYLVLHVTIDAATGRPERTHSYDERWPMPMDTVDPSNTNLPSPTSPQSSPRRPSSPSDYSNHSQSLSQSLAQAGRPFSPPGGSKSPRSPTSRRSPGSPTASPSRAAGAGARAGRSSSHGSGSGSSSTLKARVPLLLKALALAEGTVIDNVDPGSLSPYDSHSHSHSHPAHASSYRQHEHAGSSSSSSIDFLVSRRLVDALGHVLNTQAFSSGSVSGGIGGGAGAGSGSGSGNGSGSGLGGLGGGIGGLGGSVGGGMASSAGAVPAPVSISSLYAARYRAAGSVGVGGSLESLEGLLHGEEGTRMDQDPGSQDSQEHERLETSQDGANIPYSEVLAWLDRSIVDPPTIPTGLGSSSSSSSSSGGSGSSGGGGGSSINMNLGGGSAGVSLLGTAMNVSSSSVLSPRRVHRDGMSLSSSSHLSHLSNSGSMPMPVRTQQAISSLSGTRPTHIHGFSSTLVHTVSSGPGRSRSSRASKKNGKDGKKNGNHGKDGKDGQVGSGSSAEESDDAQASGSSGRDVSPSVVEGSRSPSNDSPTLDDSPNEIDMAAASNEADMSTRSGLLGFPGLYQQPDSTQRRSNSVLSTMSISDQEQMSVHHSESEVEGEMELGEDAGERDSSVNGGTSKANSSSSSSSSSGSSSLPTLQISSCTNATIYLLSPYRSALISNCTSCLIVIGAVAGPVHISNCDKCSITVLCKKCVVMNSLDCEINLATALVSVTSGDCRGLVFGPHNVAYRSLQTHAALAGLHSLFFASANSGGAALGGGEVSSGLTNSMSLINPTPTAGLGPQSTGSESSISSTTNMWSVLCDVSLCVDAIAAFGSPSGYAMDAAELQTPLPGPLSSTASILPPERFSYLSIPDRTEYQHQNGGAGASEGESASAGAGANVNVSASGRYGVPLPAQYVAALGQRKERLVALQKMIESVAAEALPAPMSATAEDGSSSGSGGGVGHSDTMTPAAQLDSEIADRISAKFMDWMVAGGHVTQLLDLIVLDEEKDKTGH